MLNVANGGVRDRQKGSGRISHGKSRTQHKGTHNQSRCPIEHYNDVTACAGCATFEISATTVFCYRSFEKLPELGEDRMSKI
jgi:hypothetical protein